MCVKKEFVKKGFALAKLLVVIALLLGSMVIWPGCTKSHKNGQQKEHAKIQSKCIKIMPLGDSITAGYFTNDGGYRSRLQHQLIKANVNFKFVGREKEQSGDMNNPEHEGYAGFRIRAIAKAADEAVKLFEPDVILLFAGTNDLIHDLTGVTDGSVHQDPDYWGTAPERLSELITQLHSHNPEVVIIVGTLLPFTGKWALAEPRAIDFNRKLLAIVEQQVQQGNKVFIADMRKAVSPDGLSDGVHPNQLGYEKMAEVWFKSLCETVKCP